MTRKTRRLLYRSRYKNRAPGTPDPRARAVFNPGLVDGNADWTIKNTPAVGGAPRVDVVRRKGFVPLDLQNADARSVRMHEMGHVMFSPVLSPAELCRKRNVDPLTFQACEDGRVNSGLLREVSTAPEALAGAGALVREQWAQKAPAHIPADEVARERLRLLVASRGYCPDAELQSMADAAGIGAELRELRDLLDLGSRAKTRLAGIESTLEAARLIAGYAPAKPERPKGPGGGKSGEGSERDGRGSGAGSGEATEERKAAAAKPGPAPAERAADRAAVKKEATRQRVEKHREAKEAAKQEERERGTMAAITEPTDRWERGAVPIATRKGTMEVTKPDLHIEKLPLQRARKRRGEGRRPRRVGAVIERADRVAAPFGGPAFGGPARRGHTPRGTIVVDVSGSMSLTVEDVDRFIQRGDAAEVWMYWGGAAPDGRQGGFLQRVAKGSRRVTEQTLARARTGAANLCDLQVLGWLAMRPGPRIWISDGGVTEVWDGHTDAICTACRRVARRGRVTRYATPQAYVAGEPGSLDCSWGCNDLDAPA